MAKKYSVNIEDDEVVSMEVDGIRYDSPDEIPDPDDRARIKLLMSRRPDSELSLSAGRPFDPTKIVTLVFLGVTILTLAIAIISGASTLRALAREESAPGQVVDMVPRRSQDGGLLYYPVVEIHLPDGSRQTVLLSQGSWPPAYERGERVVLAYDPQQPLSPRIKSFFGTLGMWTLSIITGILAVAFLAATLFARWMLDQSPGEVQMENSAIQ